MTRYIVLVCSAIVIALWFGYAWAEPQMNPGNWEITTNIEMAGLPTQSMTQTICITEDDLVPVSPDESSECKITDIKTSGDTVSWKMTCSADGGGMDGRGQATYRDDSMHGSMTMVMKPDGTEIRNTFSGRRVGGCDGSSTRSNAGEGLADDARDIGRAARDEAKASVVDEVRQGVRGAVRGLFK
ncbi:MAG: DUF3617 domain-containing protein [Syntrophales bacterium]|jgi:hypothetical protein|nr:DUF3617 domain-containing protein [Syntrophales bacterium]MCK9527302.1 DUF3617 domain-containing protein [Syntrophales bacterium]MDX9921228.1 DUF3617 family protein [Syntrophales bacterium]